ncbi:ABC transporter ATP-binding protein [Paracoccus ravus]|uniref:ABC transporter ATP-binding protein n=1 Tax=Paracoccus ravus TaxID=2447760 RepID=UPI00106E1AB2|nr:ABC transporter ATP-binding protein [Paracoccus ravus]
MTVVARVRGGAWIGDVPLFAPVDLTLREGQWTCLLGPSGVGKSTILRLIAGLETGARFEGEASHDRPVALMGQDPGLIPWLSVADNVTLGARLRGTLQPVQAKPRAAAPIEGATARGAAPPSGPSAEELIAAVGLTDRAQNLPDRLSGGQRQRVALARTLFENRPIVLLDEPFSALDARTRIQMQDLAARLLSSRTVLLVTHDPAEAARLGDRILLLRETGLTEWAAPGPRPAGAARPFDSAAVLEMQADLLRSMLA